MIRIRRIRIRIDVTVQLSTYQPLIFLAISSARAASDTPRALQPVVHNRGILRRDGGLSVANADSLRNDLRLYHLLANGPAAEHAEVLRFCLDADPSLIRGFVPRATQRLYV